MRMHMQAFMYSYTYFAKDTCANNLKVSEWHTYSLSVLNNLMYTEGYSVFISILEINTILYNLKSFFHAGVMHICIGDILLKTNIQVIKWKAIIQWLETEGHVFAFWDGILPENQIAVSSSFFKFMQNMEVCISVLLTLQTCWRDIGRENLFEQTGAFPDKPFPERQGLSPCWGSTRGGRGRCTWMCRPVRGGVTLPK